MKTFTGTLMALLLFLQGAWIWARDVITMNPTGRVLLSDSVFLCLLVSCIFWRRLPWIPVVTSWLFLISFFNLFPESFRRTPVGFFQANLVALLIVGAAQLNLYLSKPRRSRAVTNL